jgi:hypothetical protein
MTQTTTINTDTGEVTTNNETENINNLINITDGMSSLVNSFTQMYNSQNNNLNTDQEINTDDASNLISSIVSRQLNNLRPMIERTNANIDNINIQVTTPTNETPSIIPRDVSSVPFPIQQVPIGSLNNIPPISPLNDYTQNNLFSDIVIDDFREQTEESSTTEIEDQNDTDIDEEMEIESTNNTQNSDEDASI